MSFQTAFTLIQTPLQDKLLVLSFKQNSIKKAKDHSLALVHLCVIHNVEVRISSDHYKQTNAIYA